MPSKKIAIIGSRTYPHLNRVRAYVATLPPGTTVVSGGARGVDLTAEEAAHQQGLEVLVYPALWEQLGKGAGLERNIQIVETADIVVAFWDGASSGTLHSIREAVKRNKKVIIYGVEGKI